MPPGCGRCSCGTGWCPTVGRRRARSSRGSSGCRGCAGRSPAAGRDGAAAPTSCRGGAGSTAARTGRTRSSNPGARWSPPRSGPAFRHAGVAGLLPGPGALKRDLVGAQQLPQPLPPDLDHPDRVAGQLVGAPVGEWAPQLLGARPGRLDDEPLLLRETPGNLSGSESETHQHFWPADANCCQSLLLDPAATISINLHKRRFLLVTARGEWPQVFPYHGCAPPTELGGKDPLYGWRLILSL